MRYLNPHVVKFTGLPGGKFNLYSQPFLLLLEQGKKDWSSLGPGVLVTLQCDLLPQSQKDGVIFKS